MAVAKEVGIAYPHNAKTAFKNIWVKFKTADGGERAAEEEGGTPANTPVKTPAKAKGARATPTKTKVTPRKSAVKDEDDDSDEDYGSTAKKRGRGRSAKDPEATPTKRKRAATLKNQIEEGKQEYALGVGAISIHSEDDGDASDFKDAVSGGGSQSPLNSFERKRATRDVTVPDIDEEEWAARRAAMNQHGDPADEV